MEGWRVAQERKGMEGWAGDVMGAMAERGEGVEGWRMGEVKGLLVDEVSRGDWRVEG